MFAERLTPFWSDLQDTRLRRHAASLQTACADVIARINQGDLHRWLAAYDSLPDIPSAQWQKGRAAVTFEFFETQDINDSLLQGLQALHPWRKGPFKLGSIDVDAEWRSDMKWERVLKELPNLRDRLVLDIGCGNGYYLFRMAEESPRLLLGIEPGLLQNVQFWSIEKYLNSKAAMLPLKIQDMPDDLSGFDVIFSMGVLYHRKSPLEHIEHIRSMLGTGGKMVLETLVVDGDENTCLMPPGRYAQMRNVFFLPSVKMLQQWILKMGFKNAEVIDASLTGVNEQRSTPWMQFHSLSNFLNADQTLTNEGHPPPQRAIILAEK